jgi:hypothetical protein
VVELASSIELPANQESVFVGDLQLMLAKTFYPKDWDFWSGREALFDYLTVLVWSRVNLDFSGEAHAAREIAIILKESNDSRVINLLPHLTGCHFYHIYLVTVHGRLLHRAIANGDVERIEYNPTGTLAFDRLAEAAAMVTKSSDRISIRELASYLTRFHIGLKKMSASGYGEVAPLGLRKQPVGVNEVRGRLILEQLTLLGHDPMDMEYESSIPGIKSEVREKIWQLRLNGFAHRSKGFDEKSYNDAFKHAWDWLRENDSIRHLPSKKK